MGDKSWNTFQTTNRQECDIYELIVKSIAENPPIMKLGIEDVLGITNNIL
mgnify:CR=1 FL=1